MRRFVFCFILAASCHGREYPPPPVQWSVTRGENIAWKTTLPEGGQSAVTIHRNRVFTTMHRPISETDSKDEPNIVGLCLDAKTGDILWQVDLPGSDPKVKMAGIFSDATTFAPIADGDRVWFFNRCGSMGCFKIEDGERVWLREFQPRPRHTNRQCEPILTGDLILTVEVKDKEAGQKLQRHKPVPEGIDPRDVWTYLHAIDKDNGEIRWIGEAGTSVHNTPVPGALPDGTLAVAHGRGGGHGPLERPYGVSLTRVSDGKPIWTTDLGKCEASFQSHWNGTRVFWWQGPNHLVLDAKNGTLLKTQNACEGVDFCRFDPKSGKWSMETDAKVKVRKMPLTNQTNLLVDDWHWFLAHEEIAVGRVNWKTGKTEYLQLPAQMLPSPQSREKDQLVWEKKDATPGDTRNSRGIDVGELDKRSKGAGWGHVSAAMPARVGDFLLFPVMNGTVYVLKATPEKLDESALVAINDLGPAGRTWSLSAITFDPVSAHLFARTMKEVICIGQK
ncbi:MAG: PQQ-binding-like beta-propeller repeat protein [Verrucomicrobiales bacterium]|nr:PQQ-binding-like beta-propeller repeat protein [Verrucomicrobiales bacterium]